MHELHVFIGKGCKNENLLLGIEIWYENRNTHFSLWELDHRFIKQISNLPIADQNSSDNFFLLQSCNFHFSSLLCCVFVCICAYVFVCVSVCNICVCPLEFVGQFNSQVCLRLGSWLIRQTEASCKLKSVNNQRRHNLYIHFHHYQTLTTEIMVLYQYSKEWGQSYL